MATTQYIGARYVPIFADPADWNSTRTYEPLTIVMHEGNSYTSRQYVPKGIDISNDDFWALTGNYNAQVEAYRKEVAAMDGRVTENAQKIADEETRAVAQEATIKSLVEDEETRAKKAESQLTQELNGVGSTVGIYNPSYGVVQNKETAFAYPFYQNCPNLNPMTSDQILLQLYIINNWYSNGALQDKLVYNNQTTFHFIKDESNENNYLPYKPTEHLTDGKMGIDCATFSQMVANSILYTQSPYVDSYFFTSQFGKAFNYLDKRVVKYWDYNTSYNAGRMLTWQWAKFLSDIGALLIIPTNENDAGMVDSYKLDGAYIGNYLPQPGDHLFMFNRETGAGRYLNIIHCAIFFDAHRISDGYEYILVDAAGTDITPNGINFRKVDSLSNVCAVYRPSLGSGYQVPKYKRESQISQSAGSLTFNIKNPVKVSVHFNTSSKFTITCVNTDSNSNEIFNFTSIEKTQNDVITFYAIPGALTITVNSTTSSDYVKVTLEN